MKFNSLPQKPQLPRNPRRLKVVDFLLWLGSVALAFVILVIAGGIDLERVRDIWQFIFAMGLVMVCYCIIHLWGKRKH